MRNNYIYLCLIFLFFFALSAKAQTGDFDVKVSLFKYKSIVGHLMVANTEGIAIEDYKGRYHIFKVADIKSVIVKKRRLPFRTYVGIGTMAGVTAGLVVALGAEKLGVTDGILEVGLLLTATGAVGGTIAGTISELTKRKLHLKVNGDATYFKEHYQQLLPYINTSLTEHFSN